MTASRPPPSPPPPVSEDDLLAYVDGLLPEDRRREVEAHLLASPDDVLRVAADVAILEGLKLLFRSTPPAARIPRSRGFRADG